MQRYVRFRTRLRVANSATPLGVFHAATKLLDSATLDASAADDAARILAWFNRHLPVPYLGREHRRAVFWFRREWNYMIQRLWELAVLLNQHGVGAELVHSADPGRVCYEDLFQIAAIPWRRCRPRHRTCA
jgi:hypothetical protein